jgi:hypothetical protein
MSEIFSSPWERALTVGDRVLTPSGQRGVIRELCPEWALVWLEAHRLVAPYDYYELRPQGAH